MKNIIFMRVFVLLIVLWGCSKEKTTTEPELPSETEHKKVVAMKDYSFDPESVTINVGDTVLWYNQDATSHTSTSGPGGQADGKWDSGYLKSGESYPHIFTEAGTYPYYCIPHYSSGMTGTVVVNP